MVVVVHELDQAQLGDVARDGGLGDREAPLGQRLDELLLAGDGVRATMSRMARWRARFVVGPRGDLDSSAATDDGGVGDDAGAEVVVGSGRSMACGAPPSAITTEPVRPVGHGGEGDADLGDHAPAMVPSAMRALDLVGTQVSPAAARRRRGPRQCR